MNAIIAAATVAANLTLSQELVACVLGLSVGLLVLARAVYAREPLVALAGILTAGSALVLHVDLSIRVEAWMHWGTLMGLGILVILLAAIAERRHGARADSSPTLRRYAAEVKREPQAGLPPASSDAPVTAHRAKPPTCLPST